MTKNLLRLIIMTTLALSIILAGCAQKDAGKTNDKNKEEEQKDEIVLAFGSEPETGFDPITGWGRYGSPLFQSTLLKRDDELKIVNDLADKLRCR